MAKITSPEWLLWEHWLGDDVKIISAYNLPISLICFTEQLLDQKPLPQDQNYSYPLSSMHINMLGVCFFFVRVIISSFVA